MGMLPTKFLICALLVGLTACSGGSSSSGYKQEAPVPPLVTSARSLLHPHYPDAAKHPVDMRESGYNYAQYDYTNGAIVLTPYWTAKALGDVKWGAGVIAHEWFHSTQDPWADPLDNEAEANTFQKEVLRTLRSN